MATTIYQPWLKGNARIHEDQGRTEKQTVGLIKEM